MHEKIQQLRKQLRLSMNGVISTSMREKGVDYKFNFGVPIPEIKELALKQEKDAELATALWKEDVRELKILATLLYPTESFTPEKANEWTAEVCHVEIAQQYCANLLEKLSFSETLAAEWITNPTGFTQIIGFILYARLCSKNIHLSDEHTEKMINEARQLFKADSSRAQRAALLAIKRYGRQTPAQANDILSRFNDLAASNFPEKQEIYNDLKFELDYYR